MSNSISQINANLENKIDAYTFSLGKEFFTGTYLNSKPIYAKLLSIGTLPNNTTKSMDTGITPDYYWVDAGNSFAFSAGAAYPIPYVDPKNSANGISARIDSSGTQLVVATGTNWSGYSAYVCVKYTKK